MAECAGLLNRYTDENPYRGFKSLPLRFIMVGHKSNTNCLVLREFARLERCFCLRLGSAKLKGKNREAWPGGNLSQQIYRREIPKAHIIYDSLFLFL